MGTTLAQYVAQVRGQYIDVDRAFGAQCWDQWSHYATNFLGVPAWPTYTNAGGTSPHSGWACNVYHNAKAAGLDKWFEILPASATPRAGDVAFWELGSVWYPLSHVATVLAAPTKGGMIRCLTQNPGAVQVADLIMRGIIGYLRPKKLNPGSPDISKTPNYPAVSGEIEEDMLWIADVGGTWYLVVPAGNGKPNATTLPGNSGMGGGGAAKAGIPVIKLANVAALKKVATV